MSRDSTPSEASPASVRAEAYGLDFAAYDQIARLADLAASYWKSAALVAERGHVLTVVTHCKQGVAVTRSAFAVAKELGEGLSP
jgi:hypothetical protein